MQVGTPPGCRVIMRPWAAGRHWLIRLFIWHEIWRLFRYLWRIPTFGPFIVVALGVALVGLLVWRLSRGPIRPGHRRGGGSTGYGTGSGPRDF